MTETMADTMPRRSTAACVAISPASELAARRRNKLIDGSPPLLSPTREADPLLIGPRPGCQKNQACLRRTDGSSLARPPALGQNSARERTRGDHQGRPYT